MDTEKDNQTKVDSVAGFFANESQKHLQESHIPQNSKYVAHNIKIKERVRDDFKDLQYTLKFVEYNLDLTQAELFERMTSLMKEWTFQTYPQLDGKLIKAKK